MELLRELIASTLVLFGAFFCLSAAVGVVRFPDVMTRLHAVTKPQVFGLILILAGTALMVWQWKVTLLVMLVAVLQMVTAPVSAHMVSRTAYRLGLWNSDQALADDLAEDLEDAGYTHLSDNEEPGGSPVRGQRWKPAASPARPRRDEG